MFQKFSTSVLALAAVVTTSFDATAQSADWNRRISDIRIVHPPGTPPGTWRAALTLDFLHGDLAPQGSTLHTDVLCLINGMPFATESLEVSVVLEVNACQFTCPSSVCKQLSLFAVSTGVAYGVDSFCYDPPGTTYACNCWLNGFQMDFVAPLPLVPTDTLEFRLLPRPGSLPELDTSDDALSILVGTEAPGVDFCFGDGSGSACPCGNSGAPGNGCANSVVATGAYLGAAGLASVSADSVVLTGVDMPNSACLYFQGTTQLAGAPFGDGLRCAGGSVVRLGTKFNALGTSSYPGGGDPSVSVKGMINPAGGNHTYQAWYRNAGGFCTPSTFNLTNGVAISWAP
jgi:hypothetical protein